ncbi:hypothetical protein PM082_009007 [Marasmius tenuissimus]|nr:hypothetical protein PM082_009007 [Marasmius tenuissimus]
MLLLRLTRLKLVVRPHAPGISAKAFLKTFPSHWHPDPAQATEAGIACSHSLTSTWICQTFRRLAALLWECGHTIGVMVMTFGKVAELYPDTEECEE